MICISIPDFGIQEMVFFPDVPHEVISGGPEFKDGYRNISDRPGLGCDVNEEAAKRYLLPPRLCTHSPQKGRQRVKAKWRRAVSGEVIS